MPQIFEGTLPVRAGLQDIGADERQASGRPGRRITAR